MARRPAEKPIGPSAGRQKGARAGKVVDVAPTLEQRLAKVEAERDILKAALTTSQAEIKTLTERQAELANRIAWALDSLHSLLEET